MKKRGNDILKNSDVWADTPVIPNHAAWTAFAFAILGIIALLAIAFIVFYPVVSGSEPISFAPVPTSPTSRPPTQKPSTPGPYTCTPNATDTAFGQNGITKLVIGELTRATANVTLSNYYYMSGYTQHPSNMGNIVPFIVRIDSQGTLDPAFGVKTFLMSNSINGAEQGAIAAVTQGNKIVIGTVSQNIYTSDIQPGLLRLDSNGNLDPSFAGGGNVTYGATSPQTSTNGNFLFDIALSPSNEIYMVIVIGSDTSIWRTTANGALDTSFGTNGIYYHPFQIGNYRFSISLFVACDSSNRALFTLFAVDENSILKLCCARLTSSGILDTSFGIGGIAINDAPGVYNELSQAGPIALQSTGKIIVLLTATYNSVRYSGLYRLNDNGTLDTTFGVNGFIMFDDTWKIDANQIKVLPNDSILVSGLYDEEKGCLLRVLPNGSIDTTFGTGGFLLLNVPISKYQTPNEPMLDSSGKYLVTGIFDRLPSTAAVTVSAAPDALESYMTRVCP